jgi:hypothetical protein
MYYIRKFTRFLLGDHPGSAVMLYIQKHFLLGLSDQFFAALWTSADPASFCEFVCHFNQTLILCQNPAYNMSSNT